MSKFDTREDLAAKIEWEGGIEEAFSYGIKHIDMPDPEIKAAWARAEIAYEAFSKVVREIEGMLPDDE
jgi:hypothetical protein